MCVNILKLKSKILYERKKNQNKNNKRINKTVLWDFVGVNIKIKFTEFVFSRITSHCSLIDMQIPLCTMVSGLFKHNISDSREKSQMVRVV
jgi:hypothetical protein